MVYLLLARRVVGYLSLLSIIAVILAAFLLAFIARALFEQPFAHALLFLDAALASLCILMIHGRHGDALTALSAVEYFHRNRRGASTPGASTEPSAQLARGEVRGDLVRNLLDKAADAALGPLATVIVGVPLGLGALAVVAHLHGRHDVVASICGGVGAVCVILGTGPYCVGRYMLDRQFDKIVRVFVNEGDENLPLLEEI